MEVQPYNDTSHACQTLSNGAVGGEVPAQLAQYTVMKPPDAPGTEIAQGEQHSWNAGSLQHETDDSKASEKSATQNMPEKVQEEQKQLSMRITKHQRGWRRVVRNFTPSYVFSVILDVQIVSLLKAASGPVRIYRRTSR